MEKSHRDKKNRYHREQLAVGDVESMSHKTVGSLEKAGGPVHRRRQAIFDINDFKAGFLGEHLESIFVEKDKVTWKVNLIPGLGKQSRIPGIDVWRLS